MLVKNHMYIFIKTHQSIHKVSQRTCQPIVVGRPLKGYLVNSADPDQMPQNAASDQGLHCLQTVYPFFSRNI